MKAQTAESIVEVNEGGVEGRMCGSFRIWRALKLLPKQKDLENNNNWRGISAGVESYLHAFCRTGSSWLLRRSFQRLPYELVTFKARQLFEILFVDLHKACIRLGMLKGLVDLWQLGVTKVHTKCIQWYTVIL